ncbi:MAG TPA: hydroxyisourate hydrolase, partial [Lacipirellulaceae bacterium]|nr:hydroxyisourate hydrolase [Lacipirellulaceae bacterium]
MASPLTTHVLDLRLGQPAAGVAVWLVKQDAVGGWHMLASGSTNDDGRLLDWLEPDALAAGVHRLTFDVGAYFEAQQVDHFFPQVAIEFRVAGPARHYHVP